MTLNDALSILIDQRLAQPASEKPPPAADRNKCRGPPPDIMQIVKDLRRLSPKWDVRSLSSELREPTGRGGRKSLRARGDEGHQETKAL